MGGPCAVGHEELDREEVEKHASGPADPILADPAGARAVIDHDLGDPNAHRRRHRGDETMHLAIEADALHHVGANHFERAAVVVDWDAGGPRDEPIGEERRDLLGERIVTVLPPAADDVVALALVELEEHGADVLRVVLKVAVGGHDHASAGMVETGGERRGLPEVPSQAQDAKRGFGLRKFEGALPGAVLRPVVDEQDLVRPAQRFERLLQFATEIRDTLDLVVEGNDDRDLGGLVQGP